MKNNQDPRHLRRIKIFKSLFSWQFDHKTTPINRPIINSIDSIDKLIRSAATKWPLEDINNVDLSILRLACFELIKEPETPTKVIINEAIEIAKRYGSKSSAPFVNGALGSIINYLPNRHDVTSRPPGED